MKCVSTLSRNMDRPEFFEADTMDTEYGVLVNGKIVRSTEYGGEFSVGGLALPTIQGSRTRAKDKGQDCFQAVRGAALITVKRTE